MKTRNICITIDSELLKYIDDLCDINCRSRSSMINWILNQHKLQDREVLNNEEK